MAALSVFVCVMSFRFDLIAQAHSERSCVCTYHIMNTARSQKPIRSDANKHSLTSAIKLRHPPFGSVNSAAWKTTQMRTSSSGDDERSPSIPVPSHYLFLSLSLGVSLCWHNGKQLNILYEKHSYTMRSVSEYERWTVAKRRYIVANSSSRASCAKCSEPSAQASDNYYVGEPFSTLTLKPAFGFRTTLPSSIRSHQTDLSNTKSTIVGRRTRQFQVYL